MVTEELLRYVEYQSNRGVDKNSIKMTLLQAGWTGEDITEAFTIVDTVKTADKAVDYSQSNAGQSISQTNTLDPSQAQTDGQSNQQSAVTGNDQTQTNPTSASQQPAQSNPANPTQSQTYPQSSAANNNQPEINTSTQLNESIQNNDLAAQEISANSAVTQSTSDQSQTRPLDQPANTGEASSSANQGDFAATSQSTDPLANIRQKLSQKANLDSADMATVANAQPAASQLNQSAQSPADQGSQPQPNQQATAPETVVNQSNSADSANKPNSSPQSQSIEQSAMQKTRPDSGEVINPGDLKYRKADEWQNTESTQTDQRISLDSSPVVNQVAATSAAMGQVGVVRPQINSDNNFNRSTNRVLTNQANPAKTLEQKKQQNRKSNSGSKAKKVILIAIILIVILAAAGWFAFSSYFARPAYTVADMVAAMKQQQYILYIVDGTLPVANFETDDSILLSRLNVDELELNIEGLVEPATSKNGFGLESNGLNFNYVFDGTNSYGNFVSLPASVSQEFSGITEQWFDFTSMQDTTQLTQLVTDSPVGSLPTVASDITRAITEANAAGLIQVAYLESEGGMDNFALSMDPATISSRLSADSQAVADLLVATGITEVSGVVSVERSRMLPMRLSLELVAVDATTDFDITLRYDYDDDPITGPPNVVPADQVLGQLQSVTAGPSYEFINERVSLVGSSASAYFNANGNYLGFCQDDSVADITNTITNLYNFEVQCVGQETAFAYQSPISDPGYYICVDGDYVNEVTQTLLDTEVNPAECGPAVAYEPPTPEPIANDEVDDSDSPAENGDGVTDDEFFE